MKKTLLVLDSIFVITIAWSFAYFLIYIIKNGEVGLGVRDIWIMYFPAIISGFLVIPINVVNLFLWSRKFNKKYGGISLESDKIMNITLPVLDFFYILVYIIFFFPALVELSVCVKERNNSFYCNQLINHEFLSLALFWLLPFLLLTALIAKFHVVQFKQDRNYLWGILVVFIALTIICLLWNQI